MKVELLFSNGGPTTEQIRAALVRIADKGVASMTCAFHEKTIYYKGVWQHRFALELHFFGARDGNHEMFDVKISAQEDSGERNTSQLRPQQRYSVIRLEMNAIMTGLEARKLMELFTSVHTYFSEQFAVVGSRIVLKDKAA